MPNTERNNETMIQTMVRFSKESDFERLGENRNCF